MPIFSILLVCSLVILCGCNGKNGGGGVTDKAVSVLKDICSKLEGVKDGDAAKWYLGKRATDKVKSAVSGPLKDVVAKVTEQITRISGNAALLEPLKGVIGKLKSAIAL